MIALIVTFNQFNVSLLKKKKTLGSQQAKHDADIIREGRLLSANTIPRFQALWLR